MTVDAAFRVTLLGAVTALLTAGCGFGTAGAAAAATGGDGGSDAVDVDDPPAIEALGVHDATSSPAELTLTVSDPEADPVVLELRFRVPLPPDGSHFFDEPVTTLAGVGPGALVLDTSATGVEYTFEWDYSAEPVLPVDGALVQDVVVYALVPGVYDEIDVGTNGVVVDLGDGRLAELPSVEPEPPGVRPTLRPTPTPPAPPRLRPLWSAPNGIDTSTLLAILSIEQQEQSWSLLRHEDDETVTVVAADRPGFALGGVQMSWLAGVVVFVDHDGRASLEWIELDAEPEAAGTGAPDRRP